MHAAALLLAVLSAEPKDDFADAQKRHGQAVQVLMDAHREAYAQQRDQYVEELSAIMTNATKAGDLDTALAAKRLLTTFANDPLRPTVEAPPTTPLRREHIAGQTWTLSGTAYEFAENGTYRIPTSNRRGTWTFSGNTLTLDPRQTHVRRFKPRAAIIISDERSSAASFVPPADLSFKIEPKTAAAAGGP